MNESQTMIHEVNMRPTASSIVIVNPDVDVIKLIIQAYFTPAWKLGRINPAILQNFNGFEQLHPYENSRGRGRDLFGAKHETRWRLQKRSLADTGSCRHSALHETRLLRTGLKKSVRYATALQNATTVPFSSVCPATVAGYPNNGSLVLLKLLFYAGFC